MTETSSKNSKQESKESLQELKELLKAVGGHCLGYITQRKSHPDPKYYVGAGKVEEIRQVAEGTGADAVIFDAFLSPSQVANLEKALGKRIMDRADWVRVWGQRGEKCVFYAARCICSLQDSPR